MSTVHPPVLGESYFQPGDIVIAWGYVGAWHEGVDYERLLILTLLAPDDRIPNKANYAVTHFYPFDIPGNVDGRIETVETFPNIVPAVEYYVDNGMDY